MVSIVKVFYIMLLSFGSTVLFVFVLKRLAYRIGFTDRPSERKSHEGEVPLVGGIAIFLGFAVCLIYLGLVAPLRFFLLGGGLLVLVGAIDDGTELSPNLRLVVHVVAALVMCLLGGVVVSNLGEIILPGIEVEFGLLSIPFTVFAVVALVNAVNMSDGLDGLCATQMLIPFAGLAFVSGIAGDTEQFLPLLALCGCLLGFLYFNLRTPWRKRATVFLGDAGSSFLGFALAWFVIDLSQGTNAVIKPVAVLWFALIVIYSTVEIVTRRLLRRRSPFEPDREHLHHVFILAGFSVSETVLALGFVTLVGVGVGISITLLDLPENALFAMFIIFGLLFLRVIFRTWKVMRFIYWSICRRRGERRGRREETWEEAERRTGGDRREPDGNADADD